MIKKTIYYSQYDQDKIVDLYFKKKKNGFFLDLGAHDGISFSNTYFFEKEREWSGICVEPIPDVYEKLCRSRVKSSNWNVCISQNDSIVTFRRVLGAPEMLSGILEFMIPEHIERINYECSVSNGTFEDIQIESKNISTILEKHGNPSIDFLSIDTEGAEFSIIKTIDFDKVDITFLTVENNHTSVEIRKYLKSKGYKVIRYVTDDFFIKDSRSILLFRIKVMYHLLKRIIKAKIKSLSTKQK
jgi:FkbM family methyltransferase